MSSSHRNFRYPIVGFLLALSLLAVLPAEAQNRGLMGYDPGSDSGFLRLWGSNDATASRLWTLSPDRTRGILQLYDDGAERVRLFVDDDSTGHLWLYNDIGHVRSAIWVDSFGQGTVLVEGSDNTERGRLAVYDTDDTGFLRLSGANGNSIALIERRAGGSNANRGRMRLFSSGSTRADLMVTATTNAGHLRLYNSQGQATITLDGATGDIAKLGNAGFLVPHPQDSSKEIFYVGLEGPERGLYARGTAELQGGAAVIYLPEHFFLMADPDTITVQLTPGSAASRGLAVIRKYADEIHVRELAGGQGSYDFDFMVVAARRDLPPLEVVRERTVFDPDGEEPGRDGDVNEQPTGPEGEPEGES